MNVRILKDDQSPTGQIYIAVENCPDPGTAPCYAIKESSHGKHLSKDLQWVGNVESIPVENGRYDGNTLYIPISREMFIQLDPYETYSFTLNGGNRSVMNIPDDLQSGYVPGTVLTMPPKRAPEPHPMPQPVQEPAPGPESVPEPAQVSETLDLGPNEKKGGKTGLVIGLALALLAAAALVWLFVLRDRGDEADLASRAPQTSEASGASDTSGASSSDPARGANAASGDSAQAPFLATAREHLKGAADAAKSLELAAPMRTGGADEATTDGAFLLVEDAAQKGEPRAMFLLGQFYDPANTLPKGTIQPDPALAIDWYQKAGTAGIAEADEALSALKTHLEAQAASGNAEASRLLEAFR